MWETCGETSVSFTKMSILAIFRATKCGRLCGKHGFPTKIMRYGITLCKFLIYKKKEDYLK